MAGMKKYRVDLVDVIANYGGKDVRSKTFVATSLKNVRARVLREFGSTISSKKFSPTAKIYRVAWVYQIGVSSEKCIGHILAAPSPAMSSLEFVWIPYDHDIELASIVKRDGSLGGRPFSRYSFEDWNDDHGL